MGGPGGSVDAEVGGKRGGAGLTAMGEVARWARAPGEEAAPGPGAEVEEEAMTDP